MDKTKQPGIEFNGIILSEISFKRDAILTVGLDVVVNFSSVRNIDGEKGTLIIDTDLKLLKNEKVFVNLLTKHVGLFSLDDNPNLNMDEFLKCHAAALVFPYIRESISDITCKAGMNPVILPPMNIIALLKDKEVSL